MFTERSEKLTQYWYATAAGWQKEHPKGHSLATSKRSFPRHIQKVIPRHIQKVIPAPHPKGHSLAGIRTRVTRVKA